MCRTNEHKDTHALAACHSNIATRYMDLFNKANRHTARVHTCAYAATLIFVFAFVQCVHTYASSIDVLTVNHHSFPKRSSCKISELPNCGAKMAFCVFSALQQKPRLGGTPSTDTVGAAHASAQAGIDVQARKHERTQTAQSAHDFLWSR